MAKIKYETLSMSNSTEVEFMTNFINYLSTIDSRITCMSNIDTEFETFAEAYDNTRTYSVGDYCIYNNQTKICNTDITTPESYNSSHWTTSTKRAEFNFRINNRFILKLLRGLSNNESGTDYEGSYGYIPILCDLNGNTITEITGGTGRGNVVYFCDSGFYNSSIAYAARKNRTYKVLTIIDADLIGIWILPFDGTLFAEENKKCLAIMTFLDTDSESWVITRQRSRIFVNTDSSNPSIAKKCSNFAVTGSVARMFNYSANAGYVDYLSHIIIKDSDGYKMADTKTLCSSTNTTPGVSYGLASGSFMSIDVNALVKVDD